MRGKVYLAFIYCLLWTVPTVAFAIVGAVLQGDVSWWWLAGALAAGIGHSAILDWYFHVRLSIRKRGEG